MFPWEVNVCVFKLNSLSSLKHLLFLLLFAQWEEPFLPLYTSQAPLLLCHASRFIFSQFSERQTGTYHPIHEAERNRELGKVGEGLTVRLTWQLLGPKETTVAPHHTKDTPCVWYSVVQCSGQEELEAQWEFAQQCTGSHSLYRGRDGNAESVKTAWKRGRGWKRVNGRGRGKRKGNSQGRLGKMYSVMPCHSFHLWFVNAELSIHCTPQELFSSVIRL